MTSFLHAQNGFFVLYIVKSNLTSQSLETNGVFVKRAHCNVYLSASEVWQPMHQQAT